MQQDLFTIRLAVERESLAIADERAAEWPTSYRLAGRAFIVTARVDGVGILTARSNSLWTATQNVREQVANALFARPQEMF